MTSSPALADSILAIRATHFDRETLRRLSEPRPWVAYRDLAISWAGIALALSAASWSRSAAAWSIAILVIGLCQYRLFVLGHEALHGNLHPKRSHNDRLALWLVYAPLLTGMDDSKRAHTKHHQRLACSDDPERYRYSLDNKNSRLRMVLLCTGVLTFFRTVERIIPYRELHSIGSTSSVLRERIPVLIWLTLFVALGMALNMPWWSYGVLWLLPIYMFVYVPDEVRSFCDHAVLVKPDADADSKRLVSYLPGRLESLVIAPFHLHFQAEHHIFPELPYYALPEVHRSIRDHSAITVRNSYIGFLWEAFWRAPLHTPEDPAAVSFSSGSFSSGSFPSGTCAARATASAGTSRSDPQSTPS